MGADTTEYYRCSCEQDVVESEQLAHENWCPGKPSGRPLILMERYPPRWRCLDHRTCEAERKRLLDDVAKSAAIETDARTELAGLS